MKSNRFPRLVLGAAALLLAGVIYAWSVLKSPLAVEFGWGKAELSLCFTITLIAFCLGGLISGLISGKVSIRDRMLLSSALICGGFLLSALNNGSLPLLYLSYGVLAGTGIGFVYNTVISATNAWFPDRKGLCSGVLMMAFGFSALLLGKLADRMFGMEAFGWRKTYIFLGVLTGVVMAVCAFIIKKPEVTSSGDANLEGMSTAEMLKTASFWKLFVFFTLLAAVGSCAIGMGKDYFIEAGLKEDAAVTVAGLLSIFNGLGRICSGYIYDRLGIARTRYVTSFVAIASPFLALIALISGSGVLAVIGLCACGFTYGFSPTVSAALVGGFFGMKHFSLNFPVLNLVLIPASFMSTAASKMSFTNTFIVLTALSVAGLIVNFTIKNNR